MSLNWLGASLNSLRIFLASSITVRKSPTPKPKLIVDSSKLLFAGSRNGVPPDGSRAGSYREPMAVMNLIYHYHSRERRLRCNRFVERNQLEPVPASTEDTLAASGEKDYTDCNDQTSKHICPKSSAFCLHTCRKIGSGSKTEANQ